MSENNETATHLQELLAGLDIPSPEWWIQQPPSVLRQLGEGIATQAKKVESLEASNEAFIRQLERAQKATDEIGIIGMVSSIAWINQIIRLGKSKNLMECDDD